MIKKLFTFTLATAMIATLMQAPAAYANPTETTNETLAATENQINQFETQMQQLDDQISVSIEKSRKQEEEIKAQQAKITKLESEIDKAKEELLSHQQVLSERLKTIQVNEQQTFTAYAEVLLSSDSLSEFINRFTAISQIVNHDTELVKGLDEKQQTLKKTEDKLHNELNELKKNQEALALEQHKIEDAKKKVEQALAAEKTKLKNQKDEIAEREAAEKEAQFVQRALQQQPTSASVAPAKLVSNFSSAAASSVDASQVIAIAKQYLGVPYVWGGSSPSGFDCSGLVQYVYRQVGVSLPRTSREQQNVGTRISPSAVQPGDLVFNGSPAYHVGIYIGNGLFLHAPQTGDVVKIASYNPSSFSSAVRLN